MMLLSCIMGIVGSSILGSWAIQGSKLGYLIVFLLWSRWFIFEFLWVPQPYGSAEHPQYPSQTQDDLLLYIFIRTLTWHKVIMWYNWLWKVPWKLVPSLAFVCSSWKWQALFTAVGGLPCCELCKVVWEIRGSLLSTIIRSVSVNVTEVMPHFTGSISTWQVKAFYLSECQGPASKC